MELSASVEIGKTLVEVWKVITDFKKCPDYIKSIVNIEIMNQPKNTLVGFKWKEIRVIFGKEATEIIWITDSVENEYYQTRAESHGSIYISRLSLEHIGHITN